MGGSTTALLEDGVVLGEKNENAFFSKMCIKFFTHLFDEKFYNLALEVIVLQHFKVLKVVQFAIFRPEILILIDGYKYV